MSPVISPHMMITLQALPESEEQLDLRVQEEEQATRDHQEVEENPDPREDQERTDSQVF